LYAAKANLNRGIAKLIADEGLGIDVVSGGELLTALRAEMPVSSIFFHGNNKSIEELRLAIDHGICLMVDNWAELTHIFQLTHDPQVPVSIMIRLKPEIEAHTHAFIQTGGVESKFGVDRQTVSEMIRAILNEPQVTLRGIHAHIGSQIFDVAPYEALAQRMAQFLNDLYQRFGLQFPDINLGGGFGIRYVQGDDPWPLSAYASHVARAFKNEMVRFNLALPRLLLEPGRSIVGAAGVTAYTVGTVKTSGDKTYVFVDGGMADNIRPMLYDARYEVILANKAAQKPTGSYCIAGKFCESGDQLGENVALPDPQVGDTVVVFTTGAYNYAMASNYNRFRRPAMVAVEDGKAVLWVRRETWDDVLQYDRD
ncbi:MAG: diaminopimelate decarboxylase, partial [Candidatus Margulisiibacteriota bacterium]